MGVEDPFQSDALGITLCVIASTISVFGVNLQKRSHVKEDQLPPALQRSYLYRPEWWVGFLCVVFGAVGDFVAFGFGQVTVIAAVGGATTLLTNVFFARVWGNEVLAVSDFSGVSCVVTAAVIMSINAPGQFLGTCAEYFALYAQTPFLVYSALLGISMLILLSMVAGSCINSCASRAMQRMMSPTIKKLETSDSKLHQHIYMLEKEVKDLKTKLGGEGGEVDPHDDLPGRDDGSTPPTDFQSAEKSRYDCFLYASCAGVIGATSVLLASTLSKCLLAIMRDHDELWENIRLYIFMGGVLITITTQTALLNEGLKRGDAMAVFPFFQAFWISFSTIGGSMLQHNYKSFTFWRWCVYTFALSLMLAGCYLLSKHKHKLAPRAASSDHLETPDRTRRAESDADEDDAPLLKGE